MRELFYNYDDVLSVVGGAERLRIPVKFGTYDSPQVQGAARLKLDGHPLTPRGPAIDRAVSR